MNVSIHNEIGTLRRVVVHQPGPEILRMTQADMERLLFDDILSPELALREHGVLQAILASHGAEVLEVRDLLTEGLRKAPDEVVAEMVREVCAAEGLPTLAPHLAAWSPERLAAGLIEGVAWEDVADAPLTLHRLRARTEYADELALAPVPNLLFMRDPAISIYDRVLAGRMARQARAREPVIARFALRWGLESPVPMLLDEDDRRLHPSLRSIEGGDLLVLSPKALMVGCSERSTPKTIERLTRDGLFEAFPHLERVYAVFMPARREVMHLDTLLTQLDRDVFLGHVPMVVGRPGREPLKVAVLERGTPPHLVPGNLLDVLRAELGAGLQLVPCGGDTALHQDREQWTDGANAVAIAPGHVLLYRRNGNTTRVMEERFGFEVAYVHTSAPPDERAQMLAECAKKQRVVYSFSGGELSRARGGARCMTLPLVREALGG